VATSFVTGKIGGTTMQVHEWSGVAILVLVLFRVVWGFVGGVHSRFIAFVTGPRKALEYARTLFRPQAKPYLGHNPLGGWSIIAMLVALGIQAGTGLFANDDILTEGPLFAWVSKDTSDWLTGIHHFNQNFLVALVALHLSAVLFHLVVKHENLIPAMVTGYKSWPEGAADASGSSIKAVLLLAALASGAYLVLY
jgi:cytochrome b